MVPPPASCCAARARAALGDHTPRWPRHHTQRCHGRRHAARIRNWRTTCAAADTAYATHTMHELPRHSAAPPGQPLAATTSMAAAAAGAAKAGLKVEYGPPTRIYDLVDHRPVLPEIINYDKNNGWQVMCEDQLR